MSYAIQPPVATPPAVAPGRQRPVPVTLAAVVLTVMAVVGLAYAIATVSTAPGTVSRFRDAAAGAASADIDGYVTVIWVGAAIGTVLAVILVALFVVLAIGLRRGSNAARIATWVVCALGLLAGLASTITVLVERNGDGNPQSLATALTDSYPGSWIGLNVGLAIAQMAGYTVVALLLLAARGAWFGRGPATPTQPHPGYAPGGYGAPTYTGAPGYGTQPGYGPPPGTPGYSPPPGTPGYGPTPGYSPQPGTSGYGPTPGTSGYGPTPGTSGYGPQPGSAGYGPTPGYGTPPAQAAQGHGVPPATQGYPSPTTAPAQSHDPNAQSYAPDPNVSAAGYSYGGPYDQAPAPGNHPASDQAHQPGGGSQWAPPPAHNDQSSTGERQPTVPPFGMPVVNPATEPSPVAPERAQPGPEDEFWSRPSS
jgi:hypothetical protein